MAASARSRSPLSRAMLAPPTTFPAASRTGNTFKDTSTAVPSLRNRRISMREKRFPWLTAW